MDTAQRIDNIGKTSVFAYFVVVLACFAGLAATLRGRPCPQFIPKYPQFIPNGGGEVVFGYR